MFAVVGEYLVLLQVANLYLMNVHDMIYVQTRFDVQTTCQSEVKQQVVFSPQSKLVVKTAQPK